MLMQTCITLQRISCYCCHHCRCMKADLQYATVVLTNGNCSSWHSSNSGYQYVYLDNIVMHSSQHKATTVQELKTWHDRYVISLNEETLIIYHSSTRGRC